jgi:hypothetical protein
MPRTPDRFPGEREDEGIKLDVGLVRPTSNGELYYVEDEGFCFYEEGVEKNLGIALVDFLLEDDPVSPNITYVVTYVSGKVTNETWRRTVDATLIKTVDYTYAGSQVSQDVSKVYDTDGITVLGQVTTAYSYSGGRITGYTRVRDA